MLRRCINRFAGKLTVSYTLTDEAPALATRALYPVIQRFCEPAGVNVELLDISVASRILCQFGLDKDNLSTLGVLGCWACTRTLLVCGASSCSSRGC